MKNILKFKNGRFRVMLVGDPHEKPADTTQRDKDIITDYLALQYAAIKELKPDLVILMGDNASGETPEELKKTLLRITKPYMESETPFAFVLGNHDLEGPVNDMKTQYDIYRSLPCCILPDESQVNDFGDYNITVESEFSEKAAYNFWLMYSGSAGPKEYYSHYGFVTEEQIRWYEAKAEELKNNNTGTVPAINIQHIPVPEEYRLLKEHSVLRMATDGVAGLNETKGKYYTLDKSKAIGYFGEAPCSSGYNSGQFASWIKTGDVRAAFFGHDHMNDFIGMVDGIILGQCKTAGFNPYGDGLKQGVRIVDLHEENPDIIDTKMVYYRELVGNSCNSIHGLESKYGDKITVKIDILKNVIKYSSPLLLTLSAIKIVKKTKK